MAGSSQELWRVFSPQSIVPGRCLARTWSDGRGDQCLKPAVAGEDFCCPHSKKCVMGRVDGPIPDAKLMEFLRLHRRRSSQKVPASSCEGDEANRGVDVSGLSPCRPDAGDSAMGGPRKVRRQASDAPSEGTGGGSSVGTPPKRQPKRQRAAGEAGDEPRPKKPKAAKGPPAKSKVKVKDEEDDLRKKLIPFGANFVKQDLKRGGRKGSAAGMTKAGAIARKYYNPNGTLKAKHKRPLGQVTPGFENTKSARIRMLKARGLANTTLVDVVSKKVDAFSPGITDALLESLPVSSTGLGEIASCRPPDAVLLRPPPLEKSSAEAGAVWPASVPEAEALWPPSGSVAPEKLLPMGDEDDEPPPMHLEAFEEPPEEADLFRVEEPRGVITTTKQAEEKPPRSGAAEQAVEAKLQRSSPEAAVDWEVPPAPPDLPQEVYGENRGKETAEESQEAPPTLQPSWPPPLPAKPTEEYTGADLQYILRGTFGHERFRAGQQEAMLSVLSRKPTLLLLSTGSGKSLCYQMPAYVLREEGLTLVISPLVSLMADQLSRLPVCLRGAIVTGQQTREQVRSVMRAVRGRLVDVLFISPERLSMWAFDGCGLPPIALACIDEAHCVSEWSHNFRPDYLRLREFLTEGLGAHRVLALTATATRPTVHSVCSILGIETIVRSDSTFSLKELLAEPTQPRVQRTNLTMDVQNCGSDDHQERLLIDILRSEEHMRSSAVVYVWKKATCDQLSRQLDVRVRGGVRSYHAGMMPEARSIVQESFMAGTTRVVVATMAFGMGLDKPDIRLVVHFNIPKSIENYIQETGRGSRDGKPGHCITLLNSRDYKSMRWMECGSGGGTGKAELVRKLLVNILEDADNKGKGTFQCHRLSDEALAMSYPDGFEASASAANASDGISPPLPKGWRPFNVAFDEQEASRMLNCPLDELHSVLVQFAYRTRGRITLFSRFPTKLKLRFFKTSADELMERDPLLRKILPMAKKTMGVHSIETAFALSQLGGEPGRLSLALWQAQGGEFSVEKADVGYMLQVLAPCDERQIDQWAEEISSINRQARSNSIAKLDAVYLALSRAAGMKDDKEATTKHSKDKDGDTVKPTTADKYLNELIDAYFAVGKGGDACVAVAGSAEAQRTIMREALGKEYRRDLDASSEMALYTAGPSANGKVAADGTRGSQEGTGDASEKVSAAQELDATIGQVVYQSVARLIMGASWPDVASDASSVGHAAAQVLAGIGSAILPARKWREHPCWGKFKGFIGGDFDALEEHCVSAVEKLRRLQKARNSSGSATAPAGSK
eukprot:TRINITY_DN49042_c0_g1_i1.p1 TRINITY_DN49042_c0_g1~~TRINITY_DN49042_c0_g1_i1.p1  ORF type:complete len:1468 (+),score=341.61 TRINITY_DN49042_c0_g1_i1:532-4404(+)